MKPPASNDQQESPASNNDQQPLAPFNECEPFELAVLAIVLSKGKKPEKHFDAAACLWARAYQHIEQLRQVYWGDEHKKLARFSPPAWGVGADEQHIKLETA